MEEIQKVTTGPALDYYFVPTAYLPIRLCFSTRVHQIPFVKARDTGESDLVVYERMWETYYEAFNPINRWLPEIRILAGIRQSLSNFPLWTSMSGWCSSIQTVFWKWICPVFRKLSLWDVNEIREAKVPAALRHTYESQFRSFWIHGDVGEKMEATLVEVLEYPKIRPKIFRNSHPWRAESTYYRDLLPTEPQPIIDEDVEFKGLYFKHGLQRWRVFILCCIWIGVSLSVSLAVTKKIDVTTGFTVGLFLIAVPTVLLWVLGLPSSGSDTGMCN
jgi:hypothetical protein